MKQKAPLGIIGDGPFSYGGGAVLNKEFIKQLKTYDPEQFVE